MTTNTRKWFYGLHVATTIILFLLWMNDRSNAVQTIETLSRKLKRVETENDTWQRESRLFGLSVTDIWKSPQPYLTKGLTLFVFVRPDFPNALDEVIFWRESEKKLKGKTDYAWVLIDPDSATTIRFLRTHRFQFRFERISPSDLDASLQAEGLFVLIVSRSNRIVGSYFSTTSTEKRQTEVLGLVERYARRANYNTELE